MRKFLIVALTIFAFNSFGQNKTYWKKKFKQGTLYVSFVKSDSQFGTHIREYFTGTDDAYLCKVRYSQGKYKLQKQNGWSNRHYIKFSNGKLIRTSPRMGSVELKRIERSEIPNYVKSRRTRYPRKVVRD
ncbi:MAG: hypothetical protein CMB99_02005 [Flavobacteriaceae bacterium]|nr:hypothetical protein [Flavobacteriaceae bacterium]